MLKRLITAVKDAIHPVRYPDHYSGKSKLKSNLYPDRWRPDFNRLKKGIGEVYHDIDNSSVVPASAKLTRQILKERNNAIRPYRGRGTGSSPEPLGKRNRDLQYCA